MIFFFKMNRRISMHLELRKLLALIILPFVFVTAFASGEINQQEFYRSSPCDSQQCCEPTIEGCGNWWFEVEALYLKASESGLAFASTTDFSTSPSGDIIFSRINNPHFRSDWGVRVSGGFDLSCGWNIAAYWTHFNSRAHGNTSIPSSFSDLILSLGFGTDQGLSASSTADSIGAHLRLRLDLADLELGREFCIGPCVTFRPFIGVRGAWTHQTYRLDASAPPFEGFTDIQLVNLKTEFEGGGLRGGFDTEWNFGCGFGLYGGAAVAVLYGTSRTHADEFNSSISPHLLDPTELFIQRDHWRGCRAITDLELGVNWRTTFCQDTIGLIVSVGYENHLFFNENRFEDLLSAEGLKGELPPRSPQFTRGDLCVQGVTFGVKFEY
jgi:Legionella pneumophila major outer membrane protein precursor